MGDNNNLDIITIEDDIEVDEPIPIHQIQVQISFTPVSFNPFISSLYCLYILNSVVVISTELPSCTQIVHYSLLYYF